MEFEHLEAAVSYYMQGRHLEQAESLMLRMQPLYQGRTLGRWHSLYAGLVRRIRPADREAFDQAVSAAARLLKGDHEGLCSVYMIAASTMITRGEWREATTYLRRIRAMVQRHGNDHRVVRYLGMTLINEGLVERASGNFARVVDLLTRGIDAMERHLYPVDPDTRRGIVTMATLDIAEAHLRLGRHRFALPVLAGINPGTLSASESNRYSYVQARYWSQVGLADRAETWLERTVARSWDPDWPMLLLEVRATIARLRGNTGLAVTMLQQALEQIGPANSPAMAGLVRAELAQVETERSAT